MNEQEIIECLGLDGKEEYTELCQRGLPGPKPPLKEVRKDEIVSWVKKNFKNQRVFLNEAKAAASVGLDVKEFRKHPNVFDACRYRHKVGYYFTHRLERIYLRDTTYSSDIESNEDFCNRIDEEPVPCCDCGKKAVRHICEKCGNPLCSACARDKFIAGFKQYICPNCFDEERG